MTNLLRIFFLFCLSVFSINLYAQNGLIKGVLEDTTSSSKIPRAAVTIMNYKDSIMFGYTRSNNFGEFEIKNIPNGKYVIIINHPMYAIYTDVVEMKNNLVIDLSRIPLLSKEMLLKEVEIVSSEAIKIKGDTIEYTADSFKVKADATVEDLLKKLPGIQVNKNGDIVAQGKKVEKVLVDGDEFFGDDPTVATQNLKAEAVDKVQVYEKKDEISGNTGDGTQTINITLKEDAKKGAFGKIKGGIGANTYNNTFWSNEFMINKFKPKERLSAYILHSNTGKLNLNWQEQRNFGDNSNLNFGDDMYMFMFNSTTDDEFTSVGGKFNGAGIPSALTGGTTFSEKWGKNDKYHLNASYQYKQVSNTANSSVKSQNFLKYSSYNKNDTTINKTNTAKHNLNLLYEVKTDSLSSLKWTIKGSTTSNDKDNDYFTEMLNTDNTRINSNARKTSTRATINHMNSSLNYLKKFKNPNRVLNAYAEYDYNDSKGTSSLFSTNSFYLADTLSFSTITDQRKTLDKNEQMIKANASYKEPISKTTAIEFRYFYQFNGQVANRLTYNKDLTGEYADRLDSLSSQYVFNFQSNRGGLNLHYTKKKLTLKLGTDISRQDYAQADKLYQTSNKRYFVNFFPTSSFVYAASKMKQLRINYNGYTQQPSISQIQPFIDNTDPFNITTGNPTLKPSFANDVTMQFYDNQVMKGRYFFAWANLNYTTNAIVTSSFIDSLRRNVTEYVNLSNGGNMQASLNLNYYMELKKYDMDVDVGPFVSYSKNNNFVNNFLNTTQNNSAGARAEVSKDIKEWFSATANYTYNYNNSGSSIQQNAKINYWTQTIGFNLDLIGKKQRFTFNTNFDYNLRQKTTAFTQNNNVFIWNASVEYKAFKAKQGVFKASVNDILNQNLGFQRNASAYSITQTRYNVIKRYFMLSFTWNFNTQKLKPAEEEGEW